MPIARRDLTAPLHKDSYSPTDCFSSARLAREWKSNGNYALTLPNWGIGSDHTRSSPGLTPPPSEPVSTPAQPATPIIQSNPEHCLKTASQPVLTPATFQEHTTVFQFYIPAKT